MQNKRLIFFLENKLNLHYTSNQHTVHRHTVISKQHHVCLYDIIQRGACEIKKNYLWSYKQCNLYRGCPTKYKRHGFQSVVQVRFLVFLKFEVLDLKTLHHRWQRRWISSVFGASDSLLDYAGRICGWDGLSTEKMTKTPHTINLQLLNYITYSNLYETVLCGIRGGAKKPY